MLFLQRTQAHRSQILSITERIERLDPEFVLNQLYESEAELRARFPSNSHIRPKIRQQLQFLRDAGYLQFLGEGRYRRVTSHIRQPAGRC
jgi:type II restriction enzyme